MTITPEQTGFLSGVEIGSDLLKAFEFETKRKYLNCCYAVEQNKRGAPGFHETVETLNRDTSLDPWDSFEQGLQRGFNTAWKWKNAEHKEKNQDDQRT